MLALVSGIETKYLVHNQAIASPEVGAAATVTSVEPAQRAGSSATSMGLPRARTVCQVLHTLGVGGAEVLAARLARQLSHRYRFLFACLDDNGTLGEELRRDGFEVHQLGRRPGIDLKCVRRLAKLARRERVDILHAHQYTPFFYASLARGWRSLPLIFTEHGRHFPDYPRRKRMLANRWLLRGRDRAIGVGGGVREALIRHEGLPPRRVSVIYNGIDCECYTTADDPNVVRRELGLNPDHFVIIHVARLNALKDHQTAVRAFARVHESLPRARLLLVGNGETRRAIETEISERRLQEYVILAGERRDVPRLLSACDTLWLTSVSEGIPLTIIEGMAAGLPIVATNVGGVPEIVQHDLTGLLAPAADDASLAAAVLRLAADAPLRRRLALEGQRRARELFSEQRMVDAYAELYDEAAHD